MPIAQGITLEPSVECPEMQDALQARIHDPLWLLARQWQFGEWRGQNAGSPTQVELQAEIAPLSRYRPGVEPATPAQAYAPATLPLETLVEREVLPTGAERDPALLAEAGLHFLRLLDAYGGGAYRAAYCSAYPLPAPTAAQRPTGDAANLRRLELLAGRIPDAGRLLHDLSLALGLDGGGPGPLPAQPALPVADQPKALAAARAWLRWFTTQGFSPASASAWLPERMEYAFAVAAYPEAGEVTLAAPEYHGGRLDWDSFTPQAGASLGAAAASRLTTSLTLPAPVSFRGMPAARLWAFEDGRVNLGAVENDLADIGRWTLAEFGMLYGDDWFMVPLEMEVGALCRVRSLTVRDSFGFVETIPHYRAVDGAAAAWRYFALAPGDPAQEDLFFLPPALGPLLESAPIEEVLLLRDEMANMAWAVERVTPGAAGLPLDRFEAFQASRRQPDAAPDRAGQELAPHAYRLGAAIPEHWIPLLPVQETTAAGLALRFRRGAMPRFGPDGGVIGSITPLGTLLQPGRPLALFGEEIPREGARVTRNAHFARWSDGSSHLWLGANKRPGRGEGSSGLRFDIVEPTGAPPPPGPGPYPALSRSSAAAFSEPAAADARDLAADTFRYGLDLI